MRSTAVLAVAFLATAGPALAAPVDPVYARQEPDSSEALSLGSLASIASLAIPLVSGLFDKLEGSGSQQQRRDLADLKEILARAEAEADDSGALSLGSIGTIVSLGSSVLGGIIDHFKSSDSSQQTRRALEELLARQEAATDPSEALSLGSIGTIFSIGSTVIGGIIDHFKNSGTAQQRRAFEELLARQETDPSEAISLGSLGTIFSIGSSVVGGIIDHFKDSDSSQPQSRELDQLKQLFARTDVDASEALALPSLADAASIASIGSSVVGIIDKLFGSDSSQRRELIDLLVRADVDESGALKLPSLSDTAGLASIAGGVVSVLHDIFGG